jgi:hypothetical protein
MDYFYFYFLSDALKIAVSNFKDVEGLMVSDDDVMEYILDDPYIWNHLHVPNKNPDKLIDMMTIYNYPNKIDLQYCGKLTDKSLLLLEYSHTLDLRRCELITDKGLKYLKSVHTLDLSWCKLITDELSASRQWRRRRQGLKHLKSVHTLNVYGCDQITDGGIIHLKLVHILDVSLCDRITDEGLKCLQYLKLVHTLDLSHWYDIIDEGCEYLENNGFFYRYGSWTKYGRHTTIIR